MDKIINRSSEYYPPLWPQTKTR